MSEQSSGANNEIEFAEQATSANDQALEQELGNDGQNSLEEQLRSAQKVALMAQAELDNFRKRMQREAEQSIKYANLPLVRDLLDVIDNLNRATDSAKAELNKAESQNTGARQTESNQALVSGVEMVSQQFASVLAKYGCKPIEALGQPFDPNVHQAISQMPSEQYPAGTITNEVAVGYMLHDRVVRPSCVIVSTGNGQ
jgi:molecular chaperone GrpE